MTITLYTTPNCPQCRISKKMLDEAGVKYQTIDLSQDEESMQMVKRLGYVAAPVVIAGNEHWSGFRHDFLVNAIAQYRNSQISEAA